MLSKLLNFLDQIATAADKVTQWAVGGLLGAIAVLVVLQVTTRYFGVPVSWSFEVVEFGLIWMVFLGASVGHRSGSVLALTVLTDRVSKKTALIFKLIAETSLIVFVSTTIYHNQTIIAFSSREDSPVLQVPMSIAAWSISVSFGLFALYAAVNIGRTICELITQNSDQSCLSTDK